MNSSISPSKNLSVVVFVGAGDLAEVRRSWESDYLADPEPPWEL